MRRRAVLAGVLLAALAGCGVPSETDVKVAGPGLSPGPAGGGDSQRPLPVRGAAATPQELVENFLAAPGDPANAQQRTRDFFPAGEQEGWKPGNKINLIRYRRADLVVTPEGSSYRVEMPVRHVGVLDGDTGALEPPTETTTRYGFRVVTGSDGSLFISQWDAHQQHLLLSTSALNVYFQQRNLYFWAGGGASLVPDLRYLPRVVDVKERPTHVVKWLLDGASNWLRPALDEMPENVALQGNVTSPDDRLEVNLSAPDVGKDPSLVDRLAAQLRWSLAPDLVADVADLVLKIDGQEQKVGIPHQPLVTDLPGTPERFALLAERVRPLNTPGADPPAASAVLAAEANSRVVRAALVRLEDDYVAALVRRSGGRQRLWVGWRHPDGGVSFRAVGDAFTSMGRPQWLPGRAGQVGLIVADGRLYRFERDAGGLTPVNVPGAGVTAMAVAPDGHRIALLAGGRLRVAPVTGDQNELQALGPMRDLPTMLTRLAGVGWSQQDRLVVAGRLPGGQTGFTEVTADGAMEDQRGGEIGNTKVSQLVAFVDNPEVSGNVAMVLYEADSRAYQLSGSVVEQISAADVAPDPKATAPPPADQPPTAPFFLDQ